MGDSNDKLLAAFSNVILCGVSVNGLTHLSKNWTHGGMYANCFIHGALGFLHHVNAFSDAPILLISMNATRYLPIPCLMADCYAYRKEISIAHLLSGVIPFGMSVAGADNPALGNAMVAVNILSLCYYSFDRENIYGWYTAGAAIIAYFGSPHFSPNVLYPLSLALMLFCGHQVFKRALGPPEPQTPPSRRARLMKKKSNQSK